MQLSSHADIGSSSNRRFFHRALGFSLCLHIVIGMVLFTLNPAATNRNDIVPGTRVMEVRLSTVQELPVPLQEEAAVETFESFEALESGNPVTPNDSADSGGTEQVDIPVDSVIADSTEASDPDNSADTQSSNINEQETVPAIDASDPDQGSATASSSSDTSESPAMLSQGNLAETLTAFSRAQRASLTQNFISDCMRYKNAHGQQADCPENEAAGFSSYQQERESMERAWSDTYYQSINQRIAREYAAQLPLLESLSKEESVLGEVAAQSLQTAQYNIDYLSENFSTLIFRNGFSICIPGPCVFRYTGFEVKRPAESAADAAPEKAQGLSEFSRTAPLFPLRK